MAATALASRPDRSAETDAESGEAAAPLAAREPVGVMRVILDQPPALTGASLRGGTRLTRRWAHGALHAALPSLDAHVVMAHYGAAQDCSLRQGARRWTSRTRPESITLIPEGEDGRWDVEGPIEVSHVYLPDDRLQSAAEPFARGRRVELIGRICLDDPTASRILKLLSHEAEHGDAAGTLFVEQALDLLCLQLVRGHSALASIESRPAPTGLAAWQVRRVTEFMTAHLDGEVSLEALAGLVGLSRFHFCRAFRRATGQTPHAWLTEIRVRRARELLANPHLPVTSVALAVGYQTPSSFATSFRRLTGTTPTAFRRGL